MSSFQLCCNLIDIPERAIRAVKIQVRDGVIQAIDAYSGAVEGFCLPGFIDAHVHIESSMLTPREFARLAVTHGTVATVSDPHEIANVLGVKGVEFMIDNARQVPFHFYFGAPSCVPATPFETAGARIDAEAVGQLLERPEVLYLSEMMDFPGVLRGETEVLQKIAHAHRLGKPVDGHAPGLRGADVKRYAKAGISTDHECFTADEALDKLAAGMWVQIREGSAAKNFEALYPLLHEHWAKMMFCSDDKHPDALVAGHIDRLCARAIAAGVDRYKVLQAACLNPIAHYRLPLGQLRVGDPADFILVDDPDSLRVQCTYIGGNPVAELGRTLIERDSCLTPNQFNATTKVESDFHVPATTEDHWVIEAFDGQLITGKQRMAPAVVNGLCVPDTERGLLKIAVVNRYRDAPIALGWISKIGLQKGAIASSVAHDSHNIVAVGANDADLCHAVNDIIDHRGGIALACDGERRILPLPIAGIMSDRDAYEVANAYSDMDQAAKALGCTLSAPFMTLSFMALLVIPHLKISDLGVFDVDAFSFVHGAGKHRPV